MCGTKRMKATEPTKRCYGYTRVSTTMQAEEGISLEHQMKKIEAWTVMNDCILVQVFSDAGISGRTMEKRKELMKVLDIIQAGEVLIVHSMSRLSRSTNDFLKISTGLEKKGCQLVILKEGFDNTTAHGKFAASMFAALAQLESDLTSERVKGAMEEKKAKGEFVGRPPYGWKLSDGKGSGLAEVPKEQSTIKIIKEMRATISESGRPMSYAKIAKALNKSKHKPPSASKCWYHTQIKRICERGEVVTQGRSDRTIISQDEKILDNILSRNAD